MSEEAAAMHRALQDLVNENNAVLRKNPMFTEADVKLARRMLNAADTSFEQDSHLIEGATWLAFTARAEARNAALEDAAKMLEDRAPELSGPDYGLASEEERKSMRAYAGICMKHASAIRAMKGEG